MIGAPSRVAEREGRCCWSRRAGGRARRRCRRADARAVPQPGRRPDRRRSGAAGRRRGRPSPTGSAPGAMLEVELAERPAAAVRAGAGRRDSRIVYDDDDIVVIDKPVGVAAHPSLGWSGPDVLGHLAGAGFRISTSGRAGAPGHRAAARRRHLRADGGGQERARLHGAEAGLPLADGRQDLPRARAGPSGSVRRHHRRADRPAPERGLQDGRDRGRPAQRHPLRHPARRSSATTLLEIKLETGRTHQIRVHMAAIQHPCVGDPMLRGRPGARRPARAGAPVAARGSARFRAPGLAASR